jgi:hypothetical protein
MGFWDPARTSQTRALGGLALQYILEGLAAQTWCRNKEPSTAIYSRARARRQRRAKWIGDQATSIEKVCLLRSSRASAALTGQHEMRRGGLVRPRRERAADVMRASRRARIYEANAAPHDSVITKAATSHSRQASETRPNEKAPKPRHHHGTPPGYAS